MNYVGKLLSNFKGFYNEINSATLTGAIDVVIIKQEDGTYVSSPWHVRFGKMGVLRAREKLVDLEINGQPVDLHMKLGDGGAAFFVQEAEETAEVPAYLATSPIPSSLELIEAGLEKLKDEALIQDAVGYSDSTPAQSNGYPESVIIPIPTDPVSGCDSTQLSNSAKDESNLLHVEEGLKRIKSASHIGTQTDMTAMEVETKVANTRTTSVSSDVAVATVDSVEMIQTEDSVDSCKLINGPQNLTVKETLLANGQKTKRLKKRRVLSQRKNDNSLVTCSKTDAPSGSNTRESMEAEGEQVMFDLEMSSDEELGTDELLCKVGRTMSLPVIEERRIRTDQWARTQYASAFHPFSDGDITPIVSPVASRPPSPKSDTEYEIQKYDAQIQTQITGDTLECGDEVQWRWGELPESNPTGAKVTPDQEDKPSGGLFTFMRKTKKMRHQPEQEGIYLDDINMDQMDPEVAALYLYRGKATEDSHQVPHHDDDNESGRGASLPQSPIPADKDLIPSTHSTKSSSGLPDIAVSLCGGLKADMGDTVMPDKFRQYLVTYEQLCHNPNLLSDSNLVVKIDDRFYNWQTAGPMVISALAYQKPLPEEAVESLLKQHLPKKETKRGWSRLWWGRGATSEAQENSIPLKKEEHSQTSPTPSVTSSAPNSPAKSNCKPKKMSEGKDETSDDESDTSEEAATSTKGSIHDEIKPNYRKSLKLTSEQVAKLKLKEGVNEASFSVTTRYQGTCRCNCYIYVWQWDDRIVISDIDGTITKSDVLGQVLPMIGKDWSQVGIANLYNIISNNGYKFVYLSARAIGQSKITRDYLRSIRQEDLSLPDGPLLLSPSSLISAFHKEVIERKPEEFKISCLRGISALFPPDINPFYCGFGNKINDVYAYRAVGIPISRVFTVNHKGELRMELNSSFQSSYTRLSDIVDHFFPPLVEGAHSSDTTSLTSKPSMARMQSGNFPEAQEFSSFTYWRQPLPDIELEIEGIKNPSTMSRSKKASESGSQASVNVPISEESK